RGPARPGHRRRRTPARREHGPPHAGRLPDTQRAGAARGVAIAPARRPPETPPEFACFGSARPSTFPSHPFAAHHSLGGRKGAGGVRFWTAGPTDSPLRLLATPSGRRSPPP